MVESERRTTLALTPDGESVSLQDYVRIVRRRKWVIALFALLSLGASIGYSAIKTPIYTGTAELLLTPLLSTSLLQATNPNLNTSPSIVDVPTDTQVIESQSVLANVSKKLKNPPGVAVSQIGSTNVVNISTSSTNAKIAAKAANVYAAAYLSVQQYQSNAALNSASQIVQGHISAVAGQITALDQQIAASTGSSSSSL
jgi:uncharacterized protein involved in exopolysaccharide biosynthesis